ncbi:methylaspartate mutase [Amycolatopsis jiangsuensis]|uniref:Methylaspartate mutase epsilon subunit n=1 Tax=Amycolatopsis jiangsuensis TaxID=1181879 RepID=A0A840J3Y1_9PSEU|nr:methylaspartate mutase [Amycolatopsis jiangsuensis]MBB4688770.1 methylaspartate mutase epsilon subunit [Amycolatopsis jiangsuensis]
MSAATVRSFPGPGADSGFPTPADSARYARDRGVLTARDVLARAAASGVPAIQPRCGVGGHAEMLRLLRALEIGAAPDILTLTIDSYTRLNRFDQALRAVNTDPAALNGYPLVTHGWRRGRELIESVSVPVEIRHGSPDARALFEVSVAAGATSFEGGGISYNLPYCKDVPLAHSLACWREVDARTAELHRAGLTLDRELFGTLTAVLVPPSISLAVGIIEACLAAAEGVVCLSLSYPQGGNLVQDVAALRAIPLLARRFLPAGVEVYPVLHEFMGVFPAQRAHADQLIFYGALTARLGGAAKLVTKTHQEALGIPDAPANVDGLRLAAVANSPLLDFVTVDEEAVDEELAWLLAEVDALAGPVLGAGDPARAVVAAFADGTLDVPFSASKHARGDVLPCRDASGAIRYAAVGGLPLPPATVRRNRQRLRLPDGEPDMATLVDRISRDIAHFPRLFGEDSR